MIFTELKQGEWFYFEFDGTPRYYAYIKTGDNSVVDLRSGKSYTLYDCLRKEVHKLAGLGNVFSNIA